MLTSFKAFSEEQIVYMTLPKGGSHLIRKVIGMIHPLPFKKLSTLNPLDYKEPVILYHHLDPSYNYVLKDSSFIKVLMIRDPRDVIVSMLEWIKVMETTPKMTRFLSLSEEEQIDELITAPDLSMNDLYPFVFDTKLGAETALLWMKNPDVLVCRFEELVGPPGGGSDLLQKKALRDLSLHLKSPLQEEELNEVAKEIFGDTVTFRKGQIGSWKKTFTKKNIETFKKTLGEKLISLGYEQDTDW